MCLLILRRVFAMAGTSSKSKLSYSYVKCALAVSKLSYSCVKYAFAMSKLSYSYVKCALAVSKLSYSCVKCVLAMRGVLNYDAKICQTSVKTRLSCDV